MLVSLGRSYGKLPTTTPLFFTPAFLMTQPRRQGVTWATADEKDHLEHIDQGSVIVIHSKDVPAFAGKYGTVFSFAFPRADHREHFEYREVFDTTGLCRNGTIYQKTLAVWKHLIGVTL